MNVVKCAIEGCSEEFRTNGAISANARFICKNHPRVVQKKVVGRTDDEKEDLTSFQSYQFDDEIGRGADPIQYVNDDSSDSSDSDFSDRPSSNVSPFWSKVLQYDA